MPGSDTPVSGGRPDLAPSLNRLSPSGSVLGGAAPLTQTVASDGSPSSELDTAQPSSCEKRLKKYESYSDDQILALIEELQLLLADRGVPLPRAPCSRNLINDFDMASPPISRPSDTCPPSTSCGRKRKSKTTAAANLQAAGRDDASFERPKRKIKKLAASRSEIVDSPASDISPLCTVRKKPPASQDVADSGPISDMSSIPPSSGTDAVVSDPPGPSTASRDGGPKPILKPEALEIPPIVISEKRSWAHLRQVFIKMGFGFDKSQNAADGVRVFPDSETNYRKMVKFLDSENIEFHTYQLPSEKLLNVVLRGLSSDFLAEDIANDLIAQGFSPEHVSVMKRVRDRRPMPLFLVKIDRSQKDIYHITSVLGLPVSVESLKARSGTGQCFRCQRFGHAQSNCRAAWRCVACGGPHSVKDCKKSPDRPPTCANCDGDHAASYKGCPRFPRPKPLARSASARVDDAGVSSATVPGRRYSDAVARPDPLSDAPVRAPQQPTSQRKTHFTPKFKGNSSSASKRSSSKKKTPASSGIVPPSATATRPFDLMGSSEAQMFHMFMQFMYFNEQFEKFRSNPQLQVSQGLSK